MGAQLSLVVVDTSQGDPDTVSALKSLLAKAEAGEVQGVAYVALHRGNGYSGDITGAARERPIYALGLAHVLEEHVAGLIRE